MKKMMICVLLLLGLTLCAAQAENRFSCDVFSIDLPDDMHVMEESARAGYEAAVQKDYPDAGTTLMVARNDAGDAIIYIAATAGSAPQQAAENAAKLLLGDASVAAEVKIGEQTAWSFACSVGNLRFDLYYMMEGANSIVIGITGMEPDAATAILGSIHM